MWCLKEIKWDDDFTKRRLIFIDGEEILTNKILMDVEIPSKTWKTVEKTVWNKKTQKPDIFPVFTSNVDTVILSHGEDNGELLSFDEIFSYINSFKDTERIRIICCFPGLCKKRYPEYSEYFLGSEEEEVWHYIFDAKKKKHVRLISSIVTERKPKGE